MSQSRAGNKNVPRQAAVIAFRRRSRKVEICLIRRKGTGTWGIPKGFIDPGDTPEEAALNEAYEEAGLSGEVIGNTLGTYDYQKRGTGFTVAVFAMEVLEEQKTWREMTFRERRWSSVADAGERLASHPVRPLLDRAVTQFSAHRSKRR